MSAREFDEQLDGQRSAGVPPVAEHLRPRPRSQGWCPVYLRLPEPADRSTWRRYDVVDFGSPADGYALPVLGEA